MPNADTPILEQLVPWLGVVVTAAGVVFNVGKDLFQTEKDTSGVVPTTVFVYGSDTAVTVRRWVPKVSNLMLLNCLAVALFATLDVLGVQVAMTVRGYEVNLTNRGSVATYVLAGNLHIICFIAWIGHLTVRVRAEGKWEHSR